MNIDGKQILRLWREAQERGMSQKQAAAALGMTKKAFNSKLYRATHAAATTENPPMMPNTNEEKVTVENDGDNLKAESYGSRICSINDLIRECKIDLQKFNITASSVRKWDVVIKDMMKEPVIIPAFYVSVTLAPKVIAQSELDIKPVKVAGRLPIMTTYPPSASGRGLIITDTQFGFRKNTSSGALDPFHDRAALDVALQIAQYERLDRLTFLGDILDLSEMSDKFVREPEFYFTTQPAIFESYWWMAQFSKATPKAERDALEGNHDLRLPLAVATRALSMHNLHPAGAKLPSMSVPSLLALDELGIKYLDGYPNNETWQGPVRVIHGDIARAGAGATAGALVALAQESTIQGHIHRIEQASKTINYRGQTRTIQAVSPGCLCRVDYVVPGHKRGQQWQQGIAVVEWDGDYSTITPIPIVNGVAIYHGRKFSARERLADLNTDTESVRNGWAF